MDIKESLASLGMTQAELSALSGVNLRQVNYIVNGKSKIDNVIGRNLKKIAHSVGASMEELLDGLPDGIMLTVTPKTVLSKRDMFVLSPEELRRMVKVEQAKEWSGWRMYPNISSALVEKIPTEWWNTYSARHIGEVMRLLKAAYDDGTRKEN